MVEGRAFLFTFPFWLIVDADDPPAVYEAAQPSGAIKIYPPFKSSPPNFVWMPPIAADKVPVPPNTMRNLPRQGVLQSLSAHPVLATGNSPTAMMLNWSDCQDGDLKDLPMDSLRIDSYCDRDIEEFTTDLMAQVRNMSNQWWINRSVAPLYGFCRNEFRIGPNGEGLERPLGKVRGTTAGRSELRIHSQIWREAIEATLVRKPTPYFRSQLLDAKYMLATGEAAMWAINAAGACDGVKDIVVEQLWKNANPTGTFVKWEVTPRFNLIDHIDGGVKNLTGKAYKQEFPEQYADLKALWALRNDVAHGKPLSFGGGSSRVDKVAASKMTAAAEHFMEWILALTLQ
jgi:hypothetical protein